MPHPAPLSERDAAKAPGSLVSLLGEARARIVEVLHRAGETEVSDLAAELGISGVAVRRHLAVLAAEELVEPVPAPQEPASMESRGRGRPAIRYRLTPAAGRLFPQSYDQFASEVLDFLADAHGREGVRAFLRWRLEREVDGLREAVTADDLHERLEQLAGALSESGFAASVEEDGEGFTLVQDHCAIYDVAKDHPEVCAYEAATFSHVLGNDVTLSRRRTLATGATACVCNVKPREGGRTNQHSQFPASTSTGTSTSPRDEETTQ